MPSRAMQIAIALSFYNTYLSNVLRLETLITVSAVGPHLPSQCVHGSVNGHACAASLGHDADGEPRLRAPAARGWAGKVAGNPGVRPGLLARLRGPRPAHLVQQWLQAHRWAPSKLRRIARSAICISTLKIR